MFIMFVHLIWHQLWLTSVDQGSNVASWLSRCCKFCHKTGCSFPRNNPWCCLG